MTTTAISRPTLPDPSTFKGTLATEENMPYVLMCLEAADDIAVDTEASGLNVANPNCDYLMGFCVDVPDLSAYLPFRHKARNIDKRWLEPLDRIFRTKPLIWHNRKFDYHSARTIGLNPLKWHGKSYDTMLIASLVNEEWFSKELDILAKMLLKAGKVDSELFHDWGQTYGYDTIPVELAANYGPWDAVLTRALRDFLWYGEGDKHNGNMIQQELESVYWETEEPFNKLLYKMEARGVGVNKPFVEEKARIGNGRMATIRRQLGYNPASPKDLKNVLLDELNLPVIKHTKSCELCNPKRGSGNKPQPVVMHEGPPSFDKQAMEEYDELLQLLGNPTAKLIAEYRGWQKAVTALYEPLLEKAGPDGRIRTNFNQHRTVTGRLSSSGPNLQQVPRSTAKPWNGNAKFSFTAGREGYSLIGWDYAQLELRFSAAYGQEKILLTEFEKDDADPFAVLSPQIFGDKAYEPKWHCEICKISDQIRHQTKNGFVYPNLYGAGIGKIALTLGMSVEAVTPLYNNYHASIPGIMRVSKQVIDLIKQRGYVKYWDGRRRHIRDKNDAFKGWNSLLQGGSAQLVKKAMLKCEEFEDENCFMVLQVHDEITFCIKTDMIEHYRPLIEKAMTDWPQFGVKFTVDSKEWSKTA